MLQKKTVPSKALWICIVCNSNSD